MSFPLSPEVSLLLKTKKKRNDLIVDPFRFSVVTLTGHCAVSLFLTRLAAK